MQGASGDVCRAAGHHEEAEDRPGGGMCGLHGGQLQAALSSQWQDCQGQELLRLFLFYTFLYNLTFKYFIHCKVFLFLY